MKEMTKVEQLRFQKDLGYALNAARIAVLHKYGYSFTEIAEEIGSTEAIVRRIVERITNKTE